LSPENLFDIALNLGSDIPFFLSGHKFALVRNYGDCITPLNKIFVKFKIYPINVLSLSERVYKEFDNSNKQNSPDFNKSFYEIMTNNISSVTCYNNLQESVFKLYPDVKKHYMELDKFKNYKIMVNGAGSYLILLKRHTKQFNENEKPNLLMK
jgi:4-diphosphocytidyl-2-C-methyl-D-erythritol kinase